MRQTFVINVDAKKSSKMLWLSFIVCDNQPQLYLAVCDFLSNTFSSLLMLPEHSNTHTIVMMHAKQAAANCGT